jgi:hypothetical protein
VIREIWIFLRPMAFETAEAEFAAEEAMAQD